MRLQSIMGTEQPNEFGGPIQWGSSGQCIRGRRKSWHFSSFEFSDTTRYKRSMEPSAFTFTPSSLEEKVAFGELI